MSELKTRPTAASVSEFLAQQGDQRRADCEAVLRMMEAATGERAEMWGAAIVGFGRYALCFTCCFCLCIYLCFCLIGNALGFLAGLFFGRQALDFTAGVVYGGKALSLTGRFLLGGNTLCF